MLLFGSGLAEEHTESNRPENPSLEESLRYHGFEDIGALKGVLDRLKSAAQTNDRRTLVGMVQFPFSTYDHGVEVSRYENAAQLLQQFDRVFSERVIRALAGCEFESLFVREQGAMIGSGEVWLYDYDEGIRIKAINP